MEKHFKLSNEDQIDKWKSKGLCKQHLSVLGTLSDVVLSKPIKPMHVIFKGKGTLVQNDNDIIAGGPIINIYIVYIVQKLLITILFLKIVCLVQLK